MRLEEGTDGFSTLWLTSGLLKTDAARSGRSEPGGVRAPLAQILGKASCFPSTPPLPRSYLAVVRYSSEFLGPVRSISITILGRLVIDIMPLIELSAAQKAAGESALETDLKFMMSEKQIPVAVQEAIGHLGVTSIQTLADLETTKEDFRETLRQALGLDTSESFEVKLLVAKLVGLWAAAQKRVAAKDTEEAAARAEGRTRVLPVQTYAAMRRSFETVHGKFDDREFPCRSWMQARFEQLEDNDYRAESLTEVVSVQEAGDENAETGILFNPSSGTMRAAQTRIRVSPPADSEQLRHRYRLMQVHWELVKARFPDRRCFAAFDSTVWNLIVNHLLGPKIAGYRAPGGVGLRWADLLAYEFEIRRKAIEMLTDGTHTLTDALRVTYLDADLKGTHFTLQLVAAGKRDSSASSSTGEDGVAKKLRSELTAVKKQLAALQERGPKQGKGKREADRDWGKAHGWDEPPLQARPGKGGKGASGSDSAAARLKKFKATEVLKLKTDGPNGKPICHFFQRGRCVKGDSCPYPHICWRCHKPGHSILDGACKATPQYL